MRTSKGTMPSAPTIALAALTALAPACARAPSAAATPGMTPTVLIDEKGQVYRTNDGPAAIRFPTSPDSTFQAVVAGYTALGLEPTTVDPAGRVVARQRMMLRSRFKGERLSAVFDCGDGQFGPRADEGRILADIVTHVVPAGSGSSVSTMIQAALTPNDGVARDPIRCVSNGRIEEQLRREVSLRLGIPYERS
jgi:hypothetical protein